MSEAFEARISGHVQGVGYRQYTRSRALRLGLTGSVRNECDGTVTVTAEGKRQALELLIDELRRGPYFADVRDVTVTWTEPTGLIGFTAT